MVPDRSGRHIRKHGFSGLLYVMLFPDTGWNDDLAFGQYFYTFHVMLPWKSLTFLFIVLLLGVLSRHERNNEGAEAASIDFQRRHYTRISRWGY